MTVYQNQIALAQRLINEKGGDCQYMQAVTVPGVEDWRRSGRDDQPTSVKAVVLPFQGKSLQSDVRAPQATHKAYMAGADFPSDFRINSDDRLIDATGQSWQIIKGYALAPDGANILFTLEMTA